MILKERIEQLRDLAQNKKVDAYLVQEWEAVAIFDLALQAMSDTTRTTDAAPQGLELSLPADGTNAPSSGLAGVNSQPMSAGGVPSAAAAPVEEFIKRLRWHIEALERNDSVLLRVKLRQAEKERDAVVILLGEVRCYIDSPRFDEEGEVTENVDAMLAAAGKGEG